jgi:hypothetical protein
MRLFRPLSYLAPYSHSIVQSYISMLVYQPNFFRASPKTDSQIRQKFALLISIGNFGDQKFFRVQRLSVPIG